MNEDLHRLLQRQIRKHLGSPEAIPASMEPFVSAVNDAYKQFEQSRQLLERTMRLSSAELRDAMEKADEANRLKSEFLANMSHEIRTPMNAIIGLAEALVDSPMGESETHHVRVIHESAEELLRLLNDILDFSKIEAGKMDLVAELFELDPFLNRIAALFQLRAKKKGLSLILNRTSTLPAQIVADPTRLRQILVNLIGNALKFTTEGRVEIEVSAVPLGEDRTRLSFSIRDTGIGIPHERIPQLFQSFTQVDASTSREFGGTGLGLSISRKLVHLMGSDIHVESQINKGSVFSFALELSTGGGCTDPAIERRKSPESNQLLQTERKTEAIGQRYPLRILAVEDNPTNAYVIGLILKRLGYSFTLAINGREALHCIKENDFDLVLMDVQMPVMGGIDATLQLRKTVPIHTPPYIIALTAGAARDDESACLAAGMHAFLSKPVRVQELTKAFERAYYWLQNYQPVESAHPAQSS